jgi:hypothetical protein
MYLGWCYGFWDFTNKRRRRNEMAQKKRFKFKLQEHVFYISRDGVCIVTGRGVMEFASGDTLNMYQIEGSTIGFCAEYELLAIDEAKASSRKTWRG